MYSLRTFRFRNVPVVRRLFGQTSQQPTGTDRPHLGHDRQNRTYRNNLLPVVVRREKGTGHHQKFRIQIHLVQEMGQLQERHLSAVPHRLRAPAKIPGQSAREHFAGRETM